MVADIFKDVRVWMEMDERGVVWCMNDAENGCEVDGGSGIRRMELNSGAMREGVGQGSLVP